jgi:hypothetical protein
MAEQKKPVAKRELKQDALVERLIPDPAKPSDVVVLNGFLGASDRAGFWRLYLTQDLKQFVELAESDIVHNEPIPTTLSPSGGTTLWVKSDAKIEHTSTTTRQAQAQFFAGDIASGLSAAASPAALSPRGGKVKYDSINLCPTDIGPCASIFRCPTASWRFCPTEGCPSAICETTGCPTRIGCETYVWQLC